MSSDRKKARDAADTRPVIKAVAPKGVLDDDRPTVIHDAHRPADLMMSREQIITGSTIGEMIRSPEHNLSRALGTLLKKAQSDLPGAEIGPLASLLIRHDFEFDRRVGYRLSLKVFDGRNRCVEVTADLDQDGRAIRRGSLISKLISI